MRPAKLAILLVSISLLLTACGKSGPFEAFDNPAILQSILAGQTTGACPVTIAITGTPGVPGYWPSSGTCGGLGGKDVGKPSSSDTSKSIVLTTPGTYDADRQAEFIGAEVGLTFVGVNPVVSNHASVAGIAKDLYDAPQSGPFKIMNFDWCGEEITAAFNTNTITPNTLDLKGDGKTKSNSCKPLVSYSPLGTGTELFVSTKRGVDKPFTLPLQTACTGYKITIDAVENNNDWPWVGTFDFQPSLGPASNPTQYRFFKSTGATLCQSNKNSIEVLLDIDGTQHVKDVKVRACDYSADYGGTAFSISCTGVVDPDKNKGLCESSGFAWSDAVNASPVNNPPQACCGDDGDVDLAKHPAFYTCSKDTTGKFTWSAPNRQCINGNCCLGPANESAVLQVDSTQFMCMNVTNVWSWKNATLETTSYTVKGKSVASNGVAWIVCGNTVNASTFAVPGANITLVNTPPASAPTNLLPLNNNACGSAVPCGCDTSLQSACAFEGPGSHSCALCDQEEATCTPTTTTCDAFPTTTCVSNSCICAPNKVWNGTQCATPACANSTTYDQVTALCQPAATTPAAPVTSILLAVQPVCTSVTNTKQANTSQYICTGSWQPFANDVTYGMSQNNGTFASVTNPVVDAQYICKNGVPVKTDARPSQDRMAQGNCGANQCYFLPTATTPQIVRTHFNNISRCVNDGQWVLDNYCDKGNWTTRTQMLADTLIGFKQDHFVIQCDNYDQSLNDPNAPKPFAIPQQINGFCAISDLSQPGTPLVAVGTTFNGPDGISLDQLGVNGEVSGDLVIDPLFAQVSQKSFVQILNSTRLDAAQGECQNIKQNPDFTNRNDVYVACDANVGSALYDAKRATIIFTTDPDLTVDNLNRGDIDARMRIASPSTLQPLAGSKIYVAKNGNREIDAVMQPEGPIGKAGRFASIAFSGMNVSTYYAARATGQTKWSLMTKNTTTQVVKLNFTQATDAVVQQGWEYFTLQLRP